MPCRLDADNVFGPAVHGCRSDFDFTLLFEQSILQIAPCALLLLSLPWRTAYLTRQTIKTRRTGFRAVKQTAVATLAATQLALLIVWSVTPRYSTRASVPAAALSFLASVGLLCLSSFEHSRSVRPSILINVYMLASLLLDLPQARTLWMRAGPRAIPTIFTVGLAAKTLALVLEARNKRRSLFPPYNVYAPEALVSLYDRTALFWINPLFLQGYRNVISEENLYKIDSGLGSETVEADFQQAWSRRKWLLEALFSAY